MSRPNTLHNFVQFFNDLFKFLENLVIISLMVFSVITGGILSWWMQNPFLLIIPVILLVLLSLVFLIFRIVDQKRRSNRFHIVGIQNPLWGWRYLDDISYVGVIWKIRVPKNNQFDIFEIQDLKGLIAETPPRCPVCGTELEESKNIWGRYVWSCVNQDFKKSSKNNFYSESDRAEKIARRIWEEKLGES